MACSDVWNTWHRGFRSSHNHAMMTSSNGTIFRVTGPLCGEVTGPGEFPAQWPVTRSFDVFFDLRPNKRLSKQPWGWWFETPPWSLWRQCNHLLSIERADCPKLYDMLKARDVKTLYPYFPVRFPARVCALNLLSINVFLDIVARIESRCVIKAKHILLVCEFVLKCPCSFPAKNWMN